MSDLKKQVCIPCQNESPVASPDEVGLLLPQLPDWTIEQIDGENRLLRSYKFKNFKQALAFTNRVGEIAEEQQHHPTILTEWGKVTVTWWSHNIRGLHNNDLIF